MVQEILYLMMNNLVRAYYINNIIQKLPAGKGNIGNSRPVKSFVNRNEGNIDSGFGKWQFFWNVVRCQTISTVSEFYKVLQCSLMFQRVILHKY